MTNAEYIFIKSQINLIDYKFRKNVKCYSTISEAEKITAEINSLKEEIEKIQRI